MISVNGEDKLQEIPNRYTKVGKAFKSKNSQTSVKKFAEKHGRYDNNKLTVLSYQNSTKVHSYLAPGEIDSIQGRKMCAFPRYCFYVGRGRI